MSPGEPKAFGTCATCKTKIIVPPSEVIAYLAKVTEELCPIGDTVDMLMSI
jgi:hypothetical protein